MERPRSSACECELRLYHELAAFKGSQVLEAAVSVSGGRAQAPGVAVMVVAM